jgi:hypothetical protein
MFLVNYHKVTRRVQLTQAGSAVTQPITTLGNAAQKVVIEIHCFVEIQILANEKIHVSQMMRLLCLNRKDHLPAKLLLLVSDSSLYQTFEPEARTSFWTPPSPPQDASCIFPLQLPQWAPSPLHHYSHGPIFSHRD